MRAQSPAPWKHSVSTSVNSFSSSCSVEKPRRRERAKTALKSISSYFAPDDDAASLVGGLKSSMVLTAPIATIPNHRQSMSIIPTGLITSIAISVSGTPTTHKNSPTPDTQSPSSPEPKTQYPLWKEAFGRLSVTERKSLGTGSSDTPGTINDIIRITTERRDTCTEKQWKITYKDKTINLQDVAHKLLTWARKFQEIGNCLVQFDTAHASAPWEAFKLLLLIAEAENLKMGSTLVMLEKMAVLINRCAIYEGMYLGSRNCDFDPKHLEKELIKLYVTILQALVKAKRYFEMNTGARMAISIFDPGVFFSFLDEMDAQEAEVNKEANLAEKSFQRLEHQETTAQLEKLQEIMEVLKNPLERIETHISELHRHLEESKRVEVLTWISKVTYKQHHEKAAKGRVDKTGTWFVESDIFKEWQKPDTSAMLWLRGDPGTGKTKLISLVVDALLDDPKTRGSEGFAYFYCNRDKKKRKDPDSIFRAILKQLSYRAAACSIHQLLISEYERRKGEGFSSGGMALQESKKIIMELLNSCPQTTIVIDGLDQCDQAKREGLLEALQEIAASPNNPVKILVSSRDEPDIICSFKNVPSLTIGADKNAEDIRRFVEFSVRKRIESHKLLGGNVDRVLEELICSTLQQGANGVFSWVQEQIEALCGMSTDFEVSDRLGVLNGVKSFT